MACKAADGSQLTVGDYVKLYNTIVDFKNKVTKIFLETGLVKESAKLDLLPIVAMETHIVPEVQQLSSDVLLMFKLIADLIRATLVKKTKQPTLVNTLDMVSKTEVDPETLVNCSPVKQEMTDNFGESENHSFDSPSDAVEIIPVNNVTPPVLRKSSRTSVLNRKPFGKPHRQKPTVKPFGKPHRQKPSVKLVGAKKRKQGSIRKILNASLEKKKALPVIVNDADVNGVNKGRTPKAARRAAVFATNLYERTLEGMFRCKECGKEAKLQTNIRKHLRKHTGEKPYKCKLCPAVFAYPRSLKRHELVHEGIRPFKCHQCDKCFFDPTSLRTHGRVHTDDRPYVCQVCGDRFRQNEGLKGHMRRHTGDRPYVCERCGMAFAAKRSLTRHIRVHTGERPYPCDQCVAAFADWTTLHNHKLVHRYSGTVENAADVQDKVMDGRDAKSENRPYQCQFCGVGYRQPLSLKRHLRLHSANASPKKSTPKNISKRMQQDNGQLDGEAAEALHRQYRPYQCELCGAKFKHLRGHETHMNKHETGTLVSKKTSKQAKRISVQQPSSQDFEQAVTEQVATILASVAVNNTTLTSSNGIPMTVLHPQSTNSTVTVIDASAIDSLSVADPTATHLTVTNPVQDTTNVIQYTSENVTQVIQYPDGTLSQVTALVPHHPSSTLVQPMDLLDSMVTVVFEANTGTIIGETH